VDDFAEQVEPYRAELRVHCYRMLGSLTEAEDALQETLLAAWRGRDGFAGRSSLRTWLYRIATNQCLNVRRSASRRVPETPGPPFTPPPPSRLAEVTASEKELTQRFADAFTVRDVDALVALLTDDAWLAMPPAPHEYHGVPAILRFLEVSGAWRATREMRLEPVRVNTQPAFACFIDSSAAGLMALTVRGERIAGMTRFLHRLGPGLQDQATARDDRST
jgi:RNA polymerase sigma factor (sigma-70 family)